MRLIDLINTLQDLYNTYDDEYKEVMGEPEIVIDSFDRIGNTHTFEYAGYNDKIVVEKTDCGSYDIINKFGNQNETAEAEKPVWPFPPLKQEARVDEKETETQ